MFINLLIRAAPAGKAEQANCDVQEKKFDLKGCQNL